MRTKHEADGYTLRIIFEQPNLMCDYTIKFDEKPTPEQIAKYMQEKMLHLVVDMQVADDMRKDDE